LQQQVALKKSFSEDPIYFCDVQPHVRPLYMQPHIDLVSGVHQSCDVEYSRAHEESGGQFDLAD